MIKKAYFGLTLEKALNALELVSILLVLGIAIVMEVFFSQIPCPLCILQRIGFYLTALGFLMNLRFGLRPSHYSMVILGSLFTAVVALRHIAMNIVPGSGSQGPEVFEIHLYSWALVISLLLILVTTILSGFERQYVKPKTVKLNYLTNSLFAILTTIISINIVTLFIERGFDF